MRVLTTVPRSTLAEAVGRVYIATRKLGNRPFVFSIDTSTSTMECAPLFHAVRHSPQGFDWGAQNAGAADLARSLLIDVLDSGAFCSSCRGVGRVEYSKACPDCWGDGTSVLVELTYHAFKAEEIASRRPEGFAITADAIRTWLRDHLDRRVVSA